MFSAIFAFVLVTAYAAEELPSYIRVCGRKNPNYNECLSDSINIAKNKVCTGMPEFGIPPSEPLTVDKVVFYNSDNLKLNIEDVKVTGFCNFEVKSVNTSSDRLHFEIDVVHKHIQLVSKYDVDIRILVPLINKGLVHIFLDNLDSKLILDLKIETKNNKTEVYASKVNVNTYIKSFTFEFDNSMKDLIQLHEGIRQVVNNNQQDFLNIIEPVMEKKISEIIVSVINKITYKRMEQVFPDKP
ncbi:PREDICTED: uncharacterized protein LOC105460784 isoform X1 [Wasmannia auropunctata]|uniref:uncharacterized protein LOC105460784 isoform X1 n=1 Tax=Wasmannia auropunctata TaxID=64793 RepID=UPI0005EF330A|nr:PREDICTED: uncharacterized protein LOC105460784 isoform X1 [Wasmannia auropunctata]XP_011705580.1 PREDICTED: uncharacterized protein LOC105460784 isoform X1 [Wasmannia auropunctata]